MAPPVGSRLKMPRWLESSFEKLDLESDARRQKGEVNKYNRPTVLVMLSFALIAVVYGAMETMKPPPDVAPIIAADESYLKFKSGEVHFGAQEKGAKVYPIELPDRRLSRYVDFNPADIWYEFQVDIPAERFKKNQTGLLIPKVWGRSEVYLNKYKINFGLNVRPLFGLEEAKNTVIIHVSADNSKKVGMRSTYPLVVNDIDKLRALDESINVQYMTPFKALVAQLVVGALFIGLFLVLPSKPELLTFVLFTIFNVIYGYLYIVGDRNETIILNSAAAQEFVVQVVDYIRSYILFRFTIEFFRVSDARAKSLSRNALGWSVVILPLLLFSFKRLSPASDTGTLFHVLQQGYFLVWCITLSVWVSSYLFFHLSHRYRAIVGLAVFGGVLFSFATNLHDFWFASDLMTGEYKNSLITYFMMAGLIATEFARTEKEKNDLAQNLPRETREKYFRKVGQLKSSHEGFVLLVDGVGFSTLQESVPADFQGTLSATLNEYLLEIASQIDGVSVLNGTGDGYYFAWENELSQEFFDKIVEVANALSKSVLTIDLGTFKGEIRFRASLGYGTYFVGVSRKSELMRDYSAGKLLTDLARVIGNASDERGIRVLGSNKLDSFCEKRSAKPEILVAKHGATFKFYSVESLKVDKAPSKAA